MGLTDWEVYKQNAGQVFAIEVTNPLHGSGSFKFNRGGTAGEYVNIRRVNTPRGFTSGRARWLFGREASYLLSTRAGFVFQQSQADLTGAAGTAYYACIFLSNSASSHRLEIRRLTAGIPGGGTQLFQGTNTFTMTQGGTVSLEIEWVLDIANLGGLRFNFKRGTATDFSNLVNEPGLTNVVTTTTLLQTSVGEGPASYLGPTTQFDHLYDRISCVPLVVGG